MVNILVQPENVWAYFEKVLKPDGMDLIAECGEYGTSVYISELNNRPLITVLSDDYPVYEEEVTDEKDCFGIVSQIYDDFLTSNAVEIIDEIMQDDGGFMPTPDYEKMDFDLEIEVREEELDEAVIEFLSVTCDFIDINTNEVKEMIKDVKEHFLEYLYKKHGLEPRRPMWLVDEKGEEFFEEYPYDCIID